VALQSKPIKHGLATLIDSRMHKRIRGKIQSKARNPFVNP